jgi:phosphohistidine phosphatase SixA
MGNLDESLYSTTPDNAIPLTDLGWEQARAAGRRLKQSILPKYCQVHFIVSPYVRTVETFHGMASAWCDPQSFSHIADRNDRLKAWYSALLEVSTYDSIALCGELSWLTHLPHSPQHGITWAEDPRIREQVRPSQYDKRHCVVPMLSTCVIALLGLWKLTKP